MGKLHQKAHLIQSLKIINPNNAGGEEIINDLEMDRYTSVDDFKTQLCEQFSEYTEGCETQFVNVVPGHGMKGKQEKISTDEHLAVMYEKHKKKKPILLAKVYTEIKEESKHSR